MEGLNGRGVTSGACSDAGDAPCGGGRVSNGARLGQTDRNYPENRSASVAGGGGA